MTLHEALHRTDRYFLDLKGIWKDMMREGRILMDIQNEQTNLRTQIFQLTNPDDTTEIWVVNQKDSKIIDMDNVEDLVDTPISITVNMKGEIDTCIG